MKTFKLNNFVCKCGNTKVFANSSGLFCSECGIRVARYTKINEKVLLRCVNICESTPSCSVCKINKDCRDYDIRPADVQQFINEQIRKLSFHTSCSFCIEHIADPAIQEIQWLK